MQVKKFEARTIKEALAMVKQQLGPDAIILSAKERSTGWGANAIPIIEVTAAVSETTLRKKHIAEKKLREQDLIRFSNSSAKSQKQFIDRVFAPPPEEEEEQVARPLTSTRYIDIDEDKAASAAAPRTRQPQQATRPTARQSAPSEQQLRAQVARSLDGVPDQNPHVQERIRSLAREALNASGLAGNPFIKSQKPEAAASRQQIPQSAVRQAAAQTQQQNVAVQKAAAQQNSGEIVQLREEIYRLREVIEGIQKVPTQFIEYHPGANHNLGYEVSQTFEKLVRVGIQEDLVAEILKAAQTDVPRTQQKNSALIDAFAAKWIMERTQTVPTRTMGRYHAFVGPSGHGKTTSMVKWGSQLVLQEKKKVAFITTDTFKVGASDQLRIYAQILNIPFAEVTRASDWDFISKKLSHIDHILIDFPGFSLKAADEFQFMKSLIPQSPQDTKVHYVQSVLAKDEDSLELATRFQSVGVSDVIFTRLDESIRHGIIYNFNQILKWPLHSFSIGSQIPEDFESATKERVVDLIFKLSKIKKES